jgi:ATP-dependent helicase/nuclease subunit B
METFISTYVRGLIHRSNDQWSDTVIIVPNKLVGFYVQKTLKAAANRAQWMPDIITLPELACRMSKNALCSKSESLWMLLEAFRDVMPPGSQEIEHFMKWGNKMHSDFVDICDAMADARDIYRDLRAIKELDYWNIEGQGLTTAQTKFALFWSQLELIFQTWKAKQEESKRMVYPVMVRWILSHTIDWSQQWRNRRIELVGIAGFTKSEEIWLQLLGQHASVEVFWDADRYYVTPHWHEAGHNIRKSAFFSDPLQMPSLIEENTLEFHHVKCESYHGQCAALTDALFQMSEYERKRTAILLPDPTWLSPLLYLLNGQNLLSDEQNIDWNDGMGQVLWISQVLEMHIRSIGRKRGFHNKELMELLDLSKNWLLSKDDVQRNQDILIAHTKGYWKVEQLDEAGWFDTGAHILKTVLAPTSLNELWVSIRSLVLDVCDQPNEHPIGAPIRCVSEMLFHNQGQLTLSVLKWLWDMEIGALQDSGFQNFDGTLQLLLMTDTRALDFEQVLLPGFNEGSIPKKSELDSFIPYDLRALHKMSLPHDAEASYAYVFYRLLQRTKKMIVFSASVDEQWREQEASRYLEQIISELQPKNQQIGIYEKHYKLALHPADNKKFPIKNQWISDVLEIVIQKGLSASAINKYRVCPLDFYFRYIAKTGEVEDLEDTISDAELGLLVHWVLEHFYRPYSRKGRKELASSGVTHLPEYPCALDFESAINNLDHWLDEAQQAIHPQLDWTTGNNLLMRFASRDMLRKYFEMEKSDLTNGSQREVVATELGFEFLIEEETPKSPEMSKDNNSECVVVVKPKKVIKLRGVMDRVDLIDGTLRILDYKTGKVDKGDVQLKTPQRGGHLFEKKSNKLIQLLMYMLAAPTLGVIYQNLAAGFYSMRAPSDGWNWFESDLDNATWRISFEKYIVEVIQNMRDQQEWHHDPQSKYCEFCEQLGFANQQVTSDDSVTTTSNN